MKIENIVCSGALNCRIDLKKLSDECKYFVYGRNRYPGGYLKFDDHSITVYSTGKYIMPGMRSMDDARQSFEKMREILGEHIDVSKAEYPEIRNIVASSNYSFGIDLAKFYIWLLSSGYDVVYEPESFPGLILKTESATFNIFQSGKFLILGCVDVESIKSSESLLIKMLDESFRY
ncbi:MAG: hypothetical protein E7Z62_05290 [Thermoplasmata archaeon]|nr:hypothetical protein [Thermoplasmata archaeon]